MRMAGATRITCRMGRRQALDLSSRFFSWDFNDFTDQLSAGGGDTLHVTLLLQRCDDGAVCARAKK